MADRQDASDFLAFQLAIGGAALAFLLAAIGAIFVNYGIAIGCFVGAAFLFYAAHKFPEIARLRLQWPPSLAAVPQRGYWEVFRLSTLSAVAITIFASAVLGQAFYIMELRRDLKIERAAAPIRHLTDDQKERLRASLRLPQGENHSFQVNTAPSCDECEQYAADIRVFLNTIPGWSIIGGPLIFPSAQPLRGMRFVSKGGDATDSVSERVFRAFEGAGLPLARDVEPAMPQGEFVILIGRR